MTDWLFKIHDAAVLMTAAACFFIVFWIIWWSYCQVRRGIRRLRVLRELRTLRHKAERTRQLLDAQRRVNRSIH